MKDRKISFIEYTKIFQTLYIRSQILPMAPKSLATYNSTMMPYGAYNMKVKWLSISVVATSVHKDNVLGVSKFNFGIR